ncbi:MAG: hypothetical protein AAGC47_07005 [Bacteroidota bacterium]
MRRLRIFFGGMILLGLMASCDSDDSVEDQLAEPQLMVEAYVFANEHVNHVKVAKIHTEGAADLIPVDDANITISQGNKSASLDLKDEAEGIYEISDPEITFSGSEPLMLEILLDDRLYTSTTSFPAEIGPLNLSNSTVDITNSGDNLPLTTLSWADSEEGRTFCVFSKGVWADSSNAFLIQTAHDSPLYNLHSDTSVDLFSNHFTHVGSYQLYVSAVNIEYIQMYSQNSSPDLRGAPSNIDGAWGVFTAFNGRSVDINVE